MPGIVKLALVVSLVAGQIGSGALRPITVEDCVRTRRIVYHEVRLSPDGSEVAYVVKAPNLETNRNDYELYVRDLQETGIRENGRMLLQADEVSGVRWVASGRLMALAQSRSPSQVASENRLVTIDTATGTTETVGLGEKIEEYSASADGSTIVFSVNAPADDGALTAEKEKVREERGFRIAFGDGAVESAERLPKDEIFVAAKTPEGEFAPQATRFLSVDRRSG